MTLLDGIKVKKELLNELKNKIVEENPQMTSIDKSTISNETIENIKDK